MKKHSNPLISWKTYLATTLETMIAFYLATFSLAVFFTQHGSSSLLNSLIMGVLYTTVVGLCLTRIIQKFSMAALMIIIPIAPLLALISVVSLIPVLEMIK